MNYRNPIIQGFNPDPSICRVGEDYYLITSSFEYFPGIPIYHSRDLIHWKQIGNCLTRESQLPLRGVEPSGGIWAPTIRYHNGVFYVTSTNINGHGNFFVTATDPAGEWSEPVWLNIGGIDPSFTFDEGHVYYTVSHPNPEGGWGIAQAEIDITTGGLGELHHVWKGSGGKSPEAPHLYKIGDFYYLMIAEGGTYFTHMETIARSLSPWGPFESCPRNPILTNMQSLIPDVQCVGHGDLVQEPATDHFDGENLNPFWNHLRNPYPEDYSLSDPKGFLTLWGNPHTVDELIRPLSYAGGRNIMNVRFQL